ncbi:MAG TPA: glycosyltransferase family 4 protein [Cyclobacteriaceae bacterium]|jgi:glycosyltransferase involved in cell wall biosynthesis|nr:glycosyltransferase family 4 protein [Cyclobacteriaceae bacterium]
MSRLKIVYIVSDIQKALAFEWIAQSIDHTKIELTFILLGKPNSELAQELRKLNITVLEFPLGNKFIMLSTLFNVLKSIYRIKPHAIHTHLFYANLIGLTAGKLLNVPKRIFTRHHAMVHYNEYPQGLKWDRYINKIATHIVAISQNTKNILISLDKTDEEKIWVIHHGFDLNYFQTTDENEIKKLKIKYNTQGKHPVIGVISRYLLLKGIEHIIQSFKSLLNDFPDAHLILANTNGNYKTQIKKALQFLPRNSFTEIEFENDLASLYQLFDVYVHVPIDSQSEAFGQTYIEALASGIPSVFTLSGVAPEFIVHEHNALVVSFQNSEAIYNAISRILNEPQLRSTLISNGKKSAASFSIDKMVNSLTVLYEE